MGDRLRAVWDSDDLDSTEKRLLTLLTLEAVPSARAEVLSQLARVHGLRADPAEAVRLLDEAAREAGPDLTAQARIHLERGRLRRLDGDPEQALPLFEAAFQAALACGAEFVAVDAAHQAGIVAQDRTGRIEWTRRGMDLAQHSADPQIVPWLGPLLTNLGWEYFESGDYSPALDAFERALGQRERDHAPEAEVELARYAVARTLRALGAPAEAAELLERSVTGIAAEDGWFREELAECYAALGRDSDARDQAGLAIPLLAVADPQFTPGSDRERRLRELSR